MADKQLRAGAATAVITPRLGCSLSGHMTDRQATLIHDDLSARALVLDNGETKVALVVLDLIAASKDWLDRIKHQVHGFTGIPPANILISCTHTHSAAPPVPIFQTDPDGDYLQWAGPRVADAVRCAVARLRPARVGWAVGREERAVFNRRYFMKPGTPLPSPFPGIEDKVKMNPVPENPAILKPAGPTDPDVNVLAVRDTEGKPLAAFINYSLHYVGGILGTDVSADYFAVVADMFAEKVGAPRRDPKAPFVGMLANGCFGDINNVDVRKALKQPYFYHQMFTVAEMVSDAAFAAWKTIRYHDWLPIGVRDRLLDFAVRKPTADDLKYARDVLGKAPPGQLKPVHEIYARETVRLADWPERFKTPVQVIRLGDLAVVGWPGEPFCQMGLDLKAASPFQNTFVAGMANDYAGYLPTEEHHALGGYETWRAQSSFLEVPAATAVVKATKEVLAEVARAG
jgi:neutral ceramidase